MATRRFNETQDEIGDESDAVRLAAHLNINGDVHAVVTHQHVTSHVRSSQSDSNHVVRKSGVRKVTTRVVRSTTTITRGEQRTLTDNLSRHFEQHETRSTHHSQDVTTIPAIAFRPERPSRRPKVTNHTDPFRSAMKIKPADILSSSSFHVILNLNLNLGFDWHSRRNRQNKQL